MMQCFAFYTLIAAVTMSESGHSEFGYLQLKYLSQWLLSIYLSIYPM